MATLKFWENRSTEGFGAAYHWPENTLRGLFIRVLEPALENRRPPPHFVEDGRRSGAEGRGNLRVAVNLKKVMLLLVGLFAFGLVALGVLAAILIPRFVEGSVIEAAEQRGVLLDPGEVTFGWGWVQLSKAKAALIGVKGLSAEIAIVDVELDRLEPKRFTLNGVELTAVGEPIALSNRLSSWRKAHGTKFTEPVFIKPFSVSVHRAAKTPALLALQQGTLDLTEGRARLSAGSVKLEGRELGAMRVSENRGLLELGFTLGLSSLENPLLSVEAREQPTRSIHFALAPVAFGQLNAGLGTKLSLPDVKISGTIDLALPPNTLFSASGRADLTLAGYIPPHPVELDGFVFGNTTVIGSRFSVEPEALRIRLEDFQLKAGRFELKGVGQLGWEGDQARLRLTLSGHLPCAELTSAVAESRLGRALGRVSGKAARQVLQGHVGVRVVVDADTRDLERARVLKTITPGCGLRALTLAELVALGELAPEALDPNVLRDFEKLLANPLATLPNLGKDTQLVLPGLGSLNFPALPKVPAAGGGAGSTSKPGSAAKTPQAPKVTDPSAAKGK
jgi:hypothetical protein